MDRRNDSSLLPESPKPGSTSHHYALVLVLCLLIILFIAFGMVVGKTFCAHRCTRLSGSVQPKSLANPPSMYPEKTVRRDSHFIAELEEEVLKHYHKQLILPVFGFINTVSRAPPIESNVNFISHNGGLRESSISLCPSATHR